MATELKIPAVGESITEVMVGEWLVKVGETVEDGDPLVVIETDKVNVEVPAPADGRVVEILKEEGEDAEVGDVLGMFEAGEGSGESSDASAEDASNTAAESSDKTGDDESATEVAGAEDGADDSSGAGSVTVMPAARRLLDEHGLQADAVEATGPGGRLLKEDVQRHLDASSASAPASAEPSRATPASADEAPSAPPAPASPPASSGGAREEEAVRMTPLRRRVAARLVEAQQAAALLTTFNEIDMSAVMRLRKQYQDEFVKKYDIKLGFMSFFVKAVVEALKDVPQVNAEIRGDEIVYRNYQDIGVAVGGGKGLVVPVVRNAERLSFAEVEQTIADLARRAQQSKLTLEELQGGTFTISNGGIYGSLLSTPIVNPPQSGILGMHKIEERPVVVGGEIVARPMMYVALTYDHRIIDGREAVTFLVKVKERIEDPTRILLEV
ncbi:MAG: 2-oxoglutarate dehydrogenase complex dihydrolipoyllysine-residue succinyltransferase [Acidobacteriota bacterium]